MMNDMPVDDVSVPVLRNADRGRFEVVVGDQTAFLTYHLNQHVLSLIHTEVPPSLRGKRLGDALARSALDYARDQGFTVKPFCQFVAGFIHRHPEYADLVDPGFDFGDRQSS